MKTLLRLFFHLVVPISVVSIGVLMVYYTSTYDFSKASRVGVLFGVLFAIPFTILLTIVLVISGKDPYSTKKKPKFKKGKRKIATTREEFISQQAEGQIEHIQEHSIEELKEEELEKVTKKDEKEEKKDSSFLNTKERPNQANKEKTIEEEKVKVKKEEKKKIKRKIFKDYFQVFVKKFKKKKEEKSKETHKHPKKRIDSRKVEAQPILEKKSYKIMLLIDGSLTYEILLFAIQDNSLGEITSRDAREGTLTLRTEKEIIYLSIHILTRHTCELVIESARNSKAIAQIILYMKDKEKKFLKY